LLTQQKSGLIKEKSSTSTAHNVAIALLCAGRASVRIRRPTGQAPPSPERIRVATGLWPVNQNDDELRFDGPQGRGYNVIDDRPANG
jgi:hypothetical protein